MTADPAASAQPVPDDDVEDNAGQDEPYDPWARQGVPERDLPASPFEAAEYRQFLQFLNRCGGKGGRRARAEDDEDDDDDKYLGSNSGPTPTWDDSGPIVAGDDEGQAAEPWPDASSESQRGSLPRMRKIRRVMRDHIAIGLYYQCRRFKMQVSKNGSLPHGGVRTVHPHTESIELRLRRRLLRRPYCEGQGLENLNALLTQLGVQGLVPCRLDAPLLEGSIAVDDSRHETLYLPSSELRKTATCLALRPARTDRN